MIMLYLEITSFLNTCMYSCLHADDEVSHLETFAYTYFSIYYVFGLGRHILCSLS